MARPGVWQDLSSPTKLGRLVKEYNNKFSSGYGIDNIMTLAGLISGSITFTSIFLWFINFHDNSKLSADQIVLYLLVFLFLSWVVSYLVGNWWVSRRLPRWAQETMDEMVSNFTLITPDAAIRLMDPIARIRITLKLTPEQVRVLNDVHAMGTEEVRRQEIRYAASVMLENLKRVKSAAENFGNLVGKERYMNELLVSVDSAIQTASYYKNNQ